MELDTGCSIGDRFEVVYCDFGGDGIVDDAIHYWFLDHQQMLLYACVNHQQFYHDKCGPAFPWSENFKPLQVHIRRLSGASLSVEGS